MSSTTAIAPVIAAKGRSSESAAPIGALLKPPLNLLERSELASFQDADVAAVNLTGCDREPIHTPGHIQPIGFLAAMTSGWLVSKVSTNIGSFTGMLPGAWLGKRFDDLISAEAAHTLRNQASILDGPDAVQRCFALSLFEDRPPFDVALHRVGNAVVLEAEPSVIDESEAAPLVRAMVTRLKHSSDLADFYRDATRHVQALTGFDRVMIYRFDGEGHGEVIAESLRGFKDSYLGLHYPASDIPVQARALYLRNSFRIIADVASTPVPIVADGDHAERLDQSLSVLRAVSPEHIEYLRNMGVAASLSISIIVGGKLWGLFACHHHSARLPSFAYRTAAELFGEMFSMMLEGRLRRDADAHELRAQAVAALVVAEIAHDKRILGDPTRLGELIFDTVPADGLATCVDGSVSRAGEAPDPEQCKAIAARLAERFSYDVIAIDDAASLAPALAGGRAAGFMAIPLMRAPADYILLFRTEHLRTIAWAGDPAKPVPAEADGRISPRKSFATWADIVRGKSKPFSGAERQAAETIRAALVETRFRSRELELDRPIHGQDMLIAELNHRVRNILALIRGLISQTRGGAETAESFVTTLDERVQSLARAHDQLTSDRWGPASMIDLVTTEAAAYLGNKFDRVTIEGPNILVQPAAFTTLALVFHELTTNAAKYGALSDSGRVTIAWGCNERGDLVIDWTEHGGPIVEAPSRRGFGSTIIERSIPYDLGGAAAVSYSRTGFSARLCVPARHLAGVSASSSPVSLLAPGPDRFSLLSGVRALLLEDNMIIALDCSDMLTSLGAAHVTLAASVREALEAIEAEAFQFALLDFNIGAETSKAVADVLSARGIPFAFATGFDGDIHGRGHADAPVIKKPYSAPQLTLMLHKLGFGGDL